MSVGAGGGAGQDQGVVGRVEGTQDASPLSFWVAIAPNRSLQLDDVVATDRVLPNGDQVTLSGLVSQVRARHEGTRFASDVFLVEDAVLPAQTVEVAEVLTTKVEPEIFVPPWPGGEVRRVVGKERDVALSFDTMDRRLPAGLGRDGQPLYINLDFLDGTRGAHVNISGISGVATKTTYAIFLLHGLFTSGVLGGEALNTKALIFNVKGEDLLYLDRANALLPESAAAQYAALGLPATPFASVALFAPPRPGDPSAGPNVSTRTQGIDAYWWTLRELCAEELLPFVFADVEDDRQQYTMVVQNVTAKLAREHRPVGDDGAVEVEGARLARYRDLVEFLTARVTDDDSAVRTPWTGPAVAMGTAHAFVRRLWSSQRALAPLVRADVPLRERRRITTDAQVTVVDLHTLPDRAKRFVVGVTVRREFERKEASGTARPLLFLVLDELNKYAPREGASPIKEILLDVSERGRSLGVILIGAQQTASQVARRVVGQSAIRIVGRLDPAEAAREDYGFLPEAHRRRATIARPGTMFVNQPELPIPLVAEFPFPAWATRPSEAVSDAPDDPFDGFPVGPRAP